jgi:hypothetical protein
MFDRGVVKHVILRLNLDTRPGGPSKIANLIVQASDGFLSESETEPIYENRSPG